MKKISFPLILFMASLLLLSACSTPGLLDSNATLDSNENSSLPAENNDSDSASENPSLSNESNDNGGEEDPDFATVFPADQVNEITLQVSPENWQIMLDDMTENYGEQGTNKDLRPGGGAGMAPQGGNPPAAEGARPPQGANPPLAGRGVLRGADNGNPVWVEAEFTFQDQSWEHVGIRFKGNSSLKSIWSAGSLKLPFKLDFDQYEDQYPETEDQRFYGFKQLTFSSNFHDDSYLREKTAADLFREAGVAAAHTGFYAVSIDYGEGPVYLGLYTAVEVVDDTVIETQFSDDNGNVYKPEGSGAGFAAGTFTEASFDKETNQDEEDYSDILSLFDILHADLRQSDPASWRQELESVFDVNTFLNWLAVNTLIQNWDSYGVTNHNYYLYNDPETGLLVWIPWDNNESLKSSGGMRPALSLDLREVNENWPLISFLRDDPVYFQQYLSYVEKALEEVLVPADLSASFQQYHELITPYVMSESQENTLFSSPAGFERSVNALNQHIQDRVDSAEVFLASQH